MKQILNLTCLFIVFIVFNAFQITAQDLGSRPFLRRGPMKKIEELEKVKLLDILNMDEATSLKFFSSRDQSREKIFNNEDKNIEILNKIESEGKKGKDKDANKIQKLNDEYIHTSIEIEKERMNFLRSLNDILTPEQIGKYIVFEKRFREEIRDLLIKERSKHNKGKN
jgi:Spy/CpxP family protein refolding chaperone